MSQQLTGTQMLANLGEISAWLLADQKSAQRFADWYNEVSVRFDVPKPRITWRDVQAVAQEMFNQAAKAVASAS